MLCALAHAAHKAAPLPPTARIRACAHLTGRRVVGTLRLQLLDQGITGRQAALQALHLALRLLRLGLLDLQGRQGGVGSADPKSSTTCYRKRRGIQ